MGCSIWEGEGRSEELHGKLSTVASMEGRLRFVRVGGTQAPPFIGQGGGGGQAGRARAGEGAASRRVAGACGHRGEQVIGRAVSGKTGGVEAGSAGGAMRSPDRRLAPAYGHAICMGQGAEEEGGERWW